MELIKEAMMLAFEMYMKSGDEIPEPLQEAQFKGNIAYRTTPSRHYRLAREAQKQRMSLCKIIDNLIDEAIDTKKNKNPSAHGSD